jgi:hypothetical protein
MRRRWRLALLAPLILPLVLLFVAIGGLIVMLLWNWLLPALFGWPEVTFWQALGLLALCRILFGGFGGSRSRRSHVRRRIGSRIGDRIADRMAERWERMTPEDRERFRQGMRERSGFGPPADEGRGQ